MKKQPRKLTLCKETLRDLAAESLRHIEGQGTYRCPSEDIPCNVESYNCP